jgi:hypothetical protein
MFEQIIDLFKSPMGLWEALIPILASLAAAVIVYFMYQLFYASKHIGAGVHRTFIIGGPAITMIFLVIQTSIPLGLGLLGALSFVRFRTPIKDPAEIGFLLLLIASAIGSATGNYTITLLLLVVTFISLGIQWLTRNKITLFNRSHLVIAVDQASFQSMDRKLNTFLKEKLRGVKLETTSVMDGRVSLHYQYRRGANFDGTIFANELSQVVEPATVEVFIG